MSRQERRWDDLDVRAGEHTLAGGDRLIAFFKWLRHEAPPEIAFHDRVSGEKIVDANQVNWAGFSLEDAIAALGEQARR